MSIRGSPDILFAIEINIPIPPIQFSLFRCSHCPLILHSKHHLTLHEKKHTAKPEVKLTHICEVCGKAFAAPSTLRAHFGVHTDERPFPCDKCEMRFKNAYGLKCHQETHDDKKYICPVCGMSLGTNHTYHAHLKIHSDVRQYKCIVCPKAFKRHTPLKVRDYNFSHLKVIENKFKKISEKLTLIETYKICFIFFRNTYSATQISVRIVALSVLKPSSTDPVSVYTRSVCIPGNWQSWKHLAGMQRSWRNIVICHHWRRSRPSFARNMGKWSS